MIPLKVSRQSGFGGYVIKVFFLTVLILFSLQLEAQPTVTSGSVLNAASYSYPGLPGGSIAQGSLFVLFGSNLGTSAIIGNFPLSNTLGGSTIQVTSGGTTVNAIPIYTTSGQVAAILPSNTPVGAATLTLTNGGQASASVDVQVVPSSFGAFTINQAGSGPAVIQDYVSSTELPVNTITAPAYPGQTVILWGTGLGPVTGNEAVGPLPGNMQTALNVKVWVGNALATVNYAGRSGCCAGIDQVVFVVPPGVEGCYLPVSVQAGTAGVISNFPSMAVAPSAGAACSDADGINPADITTLESNGSLRLGAIDLTHISLTVVAGSAPELSDTASAVFGTYSSSELSASLGVTQSPSVGSCTVSQFLGLNPLPVDPIKPTPLDAGASLSINGPGGKQSIASTSTGVYSAVLGGVPLDQILTATPIPAYFSAGAYTLSGSGAVGSFSAQLTVPTDPTTNASSFTTIDRTKDITVTWTGAAPGDFVAISGTASVSAGLGPTATSPGDAFLCIAPGSAGTFTVPSFVLEALPSTASEFADSYLLVGTQTPAVQFSASGLDDGYVIYRSLAGNTVYYQ
jgi:uncharacterized protein (TIGR03437 family)